MVGHGGFDLGVGRLGQNFSGVEQLLEKLKQIRRLSDKSAPWAGGPETPIRLQDHHLARRIYQLANPYWEDNPEWEYDKTSDCQKHLIKIQELVESALMEGRGRV